MKYNKKTWWWCPKHKDKEGNMVGMYVRHKPEDHDKWDVDNMAYSLKLLAKERICQSITSNNPSAPSQQRGFVVDDSFRTVLLTMTDMTENQVETFEEKLREDF